MPPRKQPTPEPDAIADLRAEMADLKEHIRVLTDIMGGIREELQWLSRNGFPQGEPLPPVPVLKQMAADPCDPRWGEKLVIARGDPPTRSVNTALAPRDQEEPEAAAETAFESAPDEAAEPTDQAAAGVVSSRPELAEFFEGDSVEFVQEGQDAFGEIVTIDAARNTATVMLIPGGKEVDVSLDRLELVVPEDDGGSFAGAPAAPPVDQTGPADGVPPGKLFADPGEQKQLF